MSELVVADRAADLTGWRDSVVAGDTSPHLVDTLGGSDKRFRYYVDPTNSDEDRRDPSKSTTRGWSWVEFGRRTPAGPEFLTALLYANAKRADDRLHLTWALCR